VRELSILSIKLEVPQKHLPGFFCGQWNTCCTDGTPPCYLQDTETRLESQLVSFVTISI
jgi:hypothetical protein